MRRSLHSRQPQRAEASGGRCCLQRRLQQPVRPRRISLQLYRFAQPTCPSCTAPASAPTGRSCPPSVPRCTAAQGPARLHRGGCVYGCARGGGWGGPPALKGSQHSSQFRSWQCCNKFQYDTSQPQDCGSLRRLTLSGQPRKHKAVGLVYERRQVAHAVPVLHRQRLERQQPKVLDDLATERHIR
jgi:hypothetical protein